MASISQGKTNYSLRGRDQGHVASLSYLRNRWQ